MARNGMEDITIKGLTGSDIIFRNFEGAANAFNNAGDRNFCVIIDEELAATLQAKGFVIKHTKGGDDYPSVPYIKVKVGFTLKDGTDNQYPPRIYKIDSRGPRQLDKNTVKVLDGSRLSNVDLELSPNAYKDRNTGETRYSAWLSTMYVTIEESNLEREYNQRFANMESQVPVPGNDYPFTT